MRNWRRSGCGTLAGWGVLLGSIAAVIGIISTEDGDLQLQPPPDTKIELPPPNGREPPSSNENPSSNEKLASDAPSEPSISAIATLDRLIGKLEVGNIVFNTPDIMQLDQSEEIELLLSPTKSIEELQSELRSKKDIESATIKITDQMEAHLSGRGFAIELIIPNQPRTQAISSSRTTKWLWNVTPTRTGTQTLYLTLWIHIKVNDRKIEYKIEYIVKTFERYITVEISPQRRISRFVESVWDFVSNHEWVWTLILIPAGVFVWRRYRRV